MFSLIFLNSYLEMIDVLLILIVIIVLPIPFFITYLYYKRREVIWELDLNSQQASHYKVTPQHKHFKSIKFSEIDYLIYNHDKRADAALSPEIFTLSFYTGELKEPVIFFGLKEEFKRLGKIIAEFVGKSLYYYNGEWKEKIF
ncbi:MAG: hypothetical protein ACFFBI_04205 [Promethearchaeota archaeon]